MAVADVVVEAKSGLDTLFGLVGHGLIYIVAAVGQGHVMVHEGQRRRVEALRGDLVVGKDGGPGGSGSQRRAALRGHRGGAAGPVVEHARQIAVGQSAAEGALRPAGPLREIAAALGQRRHSYQVGRNALHDLAILYGGEEEGLVFADGTAQSTAELVLVKIRSGLIEEAARVQVGVAEELVSVAVESRWCRPW